MADDPPAPPPPSPPSPSPTTPDSTGLIYRSDEGGPGLHVLLVGIGDYRYLTGGSDEQPATYGLGQLESAARTVGELAQWLLGPDNGLAWPIRTIRLIASPSAIEAGAMPMLAAARPATMTGLSAALRAWRLDANADREGATLFYYAGHGIQRTRGDSLLLLSDFLDPEAAELAHTIAFNSVYDGMAEPQFDRMAQTQLYFVDACRSSFGGVNALANASPAQVWNITNTGTDDRNAPIFYGASVGRPAFGAMVPGRISAFGADVLRCLKGAAADFVQGPTGPKWTVTIGSLADAIASLVAEANRQPGRDLRSFTLDRWTKVEVPITTQSVAPDVTCRFTVAPGAALPHAQVTLSGVPSLQALTFGPGLGAQAIQAPGGGYIISASVSPASPTSYVMPTAQVVLLRPPFFDYGIIYT